MRKKLAALLAIGIFCSNMNVILPEPKENKGLEDVTRKEAAEIMKRMFPDMDFDFEENITKEDRIEETINQEFLNGVKQGLNNDILNETESKDIKTVMLGAEKDMQTEDLTDNIIRVLIPNGADETKAMLFY
ncbi:MAG: hypothetical protein N4A47_04125 [Clostridia bacterium]|jgi:hypothetical protein|nr:hypothetical protein [Clostridia bacterium]